MKCCKNCIHYDPVYPIIWTNKRGIEIVEFTKTCSEHATEIKPNETCEAFMRYKK